MIIVFTEEDYDNFLKTNSNLVTRNTTCIPPTQREFTSSPQPTDNSPRYFNIKEASDYTMQAVQTLYAKCSQKTIPYIKRGRRLLFLKSDLDKWLLEGRHRTKEEIRADFIKAGKL